MLKILYCWLVTFHQKRPTKKVKLTVIEDGVSHESITKHHWVCDRCGLGGVSEVDLWGEK